MTKPTRETQEQRDTTPITAADLAQADQEMRRRAGVRTGVKAGAGSGKYKY